MVKNGHGSRIQQTWERKIGGGAMIRAIDMRRDYFWVAALLVFGLGPAVSLLAANVSPAPSIRRLTILHTSDLHGQVLPFDDARNTSVDRSLAQVATLVQRVRAEEPHRVLVLDGGDTIQGSPIEQFTHVRWGEPSPTIEAMNLIAYDAMAVGNHEFNFGLDLLHRAEEMAAFPFLSANTLDETNGEPAFEPYLVVETEGVRVGILGLVTPNIPGWEQPENYQGLRFVAMDEAARHWVPLLREKEDCDLVVVLAHTGFERDPDSGEADDTEYENYAWRLTQVPGIDLLLTGHTHEDLPPREINGAIVSQPSARARMVTRIDLWLQRDGESWRIDRWEGVNDSMEDESPDVSMVAAFEQVQARVSEALDAPIGTVSDCVSVSDCQLADCAAVDLIHAVQIETSGADLSLASLLTRRTPELPAGPVTWRWVYALYVYPNTLQVVAVTGAQVKEILEHAARYYDGLDCRAGGSCVVLTDPAIPYYNIDNMAGVTYRIDPSRPEGDRVRDLRYKGSPLDLHSSYKLVCNNYRAAGGGRFPHLDNAEVVWTSSKEVTELIGEYIERNDPWRPTVDNNWWVGPEIVAEDQRAAAGGM
jgi:2',3'-cyclic-nucleotide 2'-phosphodiesterase/3'-nucleotidase